VKCAQTYIQSAHKTSTTSTVPILLVSHSILVQHVDTLVYVTFGTYM